MATYTNTLRLHDSIISVKSLPPSVFSKVRAYEYVSKGTAPNVINQRDRLKTPNGDDIVENAIFFEAEVDNSTNPPTFRQQVINGALSSNEIKIHEYNTFVPFTYPGSISLLIQERTGNYSDANVSVELDPPVQTEVEATVFEFLQTSDDLVAADYTFDGSSGFWKPNQWASIKAIGGVNSIGSAGTNPITFTASQEYRGYRLGDDFQPFFASSRDRASFNGRRVTGSGQTNNTFLNVTEVNSGPPNPVGSKFVLDIDLQPAFISFDGTTYYRKTIIVSETIPSQSSTLPYS